MNLYNSTSNELCKDCFLQVLQDYTFKDKKSKTSYTNYDKINYKVESDPSWIASSGNTSWLFLSTTIPNTITKLKNSLYNIDFHGIGTGLLKLINTVVGISLSLFSSIKLIVKSFKLPWLWVKSLSIKILGSIYLAVEFILETIRLTTAIHFKQKFKLSKLTRTLPNITNDTINNQKSIDTETKDKTYKKIKDIYHYFYKLRKNTALEYKTNPNIEKIKQSGRNAFGRIVGKKAAQTFFKYAPEILSCKLENEKISDELMKKAVKLLKLVEKQSTKVLLIHCVGISALAIATTVFILGFIALSPISLIIGLTLLGVALEWFRYYAVDCYVENQEGWNFKAMIPNICCLKKYRDDKSTNTFF